MKITFFSISQNFLTANFQNKERFFGCGKVINMICLRLAYLSDKRNRYLCPSLSSLSMQVDENKNCIYDATLENHIYDR